MNYTKISVFDENERLEVLSALLADRGITSLELVQASTYLDFLQKRNEYDWDYVDVSLNALEGVDSHLILYIEDHEEGLDLLDEILDELTVFNPLKVEIAGVDSEDWQHQWKKYFKPVHMTERIVIRPSWEEYEGKAGELVIDLDPGMAFGTGDHPTSRLCVALLEEYMSEGRPTTDSQKAETGPAVLDIGAGSGILSIAAALLGAEKVLGIEIDPKAISVAVENVKKNNLQDKIAIAEGDLNKGVDFKADFVLANLMADLVIKLSPLVKPNLKEGGVFISSGILLEKKDLVVEALEVSGFSIEKIKDEGEWCAISARLYTK